MNHPLKQEAKKYPTNTQFSQSSKRKLYERRGEKYQDPVWLIMKNPLFAEKINKLICAAREKWQELEQIKLKQNPFYKPVPCPITIDALTWISAYLRYYFLFKVDDGDTNTGFDDLVRISDILLHKLAQPFAVIREAEISETQDIW
jgi:hypothetical protein